MSNGMLFYNDPVFRWWHGNPLFAVKVADVARAKAGFAGFPEKIDHDHNHANSPEIRPHGRKRWGGGQVHPPRAFRLLCLGFG